MNWDSVYNYAHLNHFTAIDIESTVKLLTLRGMSLDWGEKVST